jgi:hypothetical protein
MRRPGHGVGVTSGMVGHGVEPAHDEDDYGVGEGVSREHSSDDGKDSVVDGERNMELIKSRLAGAGCR